MMKHQPIVSVTEPVMTSDLSAAIGAIVPALEEFSRFAAASQAPLQHTVWSAQLDEALPQHGAGLQTVLSLLSRAVIPYGVPIGKGSFFGWVTTAPTTSAVVAHLAAAVAGPQREWVHAFNLLEAVALRWLAELVGLPSSCQGIFTSGGAIANLLALGAARQYAGEQLGIDVAQSGIAGIAHPRIYASDQVHPVVLRAAAELGFGRGAVVCLPTDATWRMRPLMLRERLRADRRAGCTPVAVVATAGTASTGAVDPIPALVDCCREESVWLHVDGAYGLPGVLDAQIAGLFAGLDQADSWVIDPHKWFAAPVGTGAVFVRNGDFLRGAHRRTQAAYLESVESEAMIPSIFASWGHAYADFGLESSAPSRGAAVWAILKEIGAEGMRARVRRHNDYARYLAARIHTTPCLEQLAPVTLSICCFRYVPEELRGCDDPEARALLNQLNQRVLQQLQAAGQCIPSSTSLGDTFALRACIINPRTELSDVEALVEEVEYYGKAVWADLAQGRQVAG